MLTRRQKNSIRGITAVTVCCFMLSGFLIFTNISNTAETVPVVFSDILEGAVAYGGEDEDTPAVTLAEEELMETMFSMEYENFTPVTVQYDFDLYGRGENSGDIPLTFTEAVQPHDTVSVSRTPEQQILIPEPGQTLVEVTENSATAANSTSAVQSSGDDTPVSLPENHPIDTSEPYTDDTTNPVFSETTGKITYINDPQYTYNSVLTSPTSYTSASRTTSSTTVTTTAATTKTTKATTTTPRSTTAHTEKTPFTNVGGGVFCTDTDVYLTLFSLVNSARAAAGVNQLWYSARMHEVCEVRATELSSYYSHNRPDGTRFSTALKELGISFEKCGENIAYGRNKFKTAKEVFDAWMDSESHRENILSPDFECVAFGLSILKVGNDTYYYWTQEFAKF